MKNCSVLAAAVPYGGGKTRAREEKRKINSRKNTLRKALSKQLTTLSRQSRKTLTYHNAKRRVGYKSLYG
jgi:hypothetical protein